MIRYHNPEAKIGVDIKPYTLSLHIPDAARISLGFLANGFPDSENFLSELQKVLRKDHLVTEAHAFKKKSSSLPVPTEILAEIKDCCQAVITAYGHCGSCTNYTVRDSIEIAKLDIPVVALVTEQFWSQGDFVANSLGMPDVPRIKLPHPVAGTGNENLRKVAEQIAAKVLAALGVGYE